jgi:hypothetical protein
MKYSCDDIGYFFCIPEEIFPDNTLKNSLSSINGKVIKGVCINHRGVRMSSSQGLEWFKFSSSCPLLNDFEVFNPY